jgi:hypothetical protein
VLAAMREAGGVRLPSDAEILAGAREDGPPRHPTRWMFSATLIGSYLAPALGLASADAAGLVKSRYNALKDDGRDRYVPTVAAIAAARAAGAVPVVAHPFWECTSGRNSWDAVVADLQVLASAGLTGMETSSRHDSPADERRRAVTADRLGLVPFRSSDFHANGKTAVGQFPMDAADLIEAAARCGVALPLPALPGAGRDLALAAPIQEEEGA